MICYAFKIIAKNILRAAQDFNSVSFIIIHDYFIIFHDFVSVVIVLCIYGYEKTLRGLVKRALENITVIKWNHTEEISAI